MRGGNIPLISDTVFGPMTFDRYGWEIAEIAAGLEERDVLEIAAGTGIVSRRLRDAMRDDFRLLVTDLNQNMLDVARTKFTAD